MDNITYLYKLFLSSTGVSIDSRTIQKGNLYFSIVGERFDGSRFAEEALEKGAVAVIVPDTYPKKSSKHFACADTLNTLQKLAKHHRSQFNIPIIGITGSNGKTTTKELMREVLSRSYQVVATQGNYNNHIGVMLSLLRIQKNTDIAIIEMGANHIGEIRDLCEIAQPTAGLVTSIGKAHLEGFGGQEGVRKAKKELYDYLKKHGGVAFFNSKDPIVSQIGKNFGNPIYYGSKEGAAYASVQIGEGYLNYITKEQVTVKTQLIGEYNLNNITAAWAVGEFFNIPSSAIHKAIAQYTPKNNRSQVIKTENNTIYLDAYNANPTSMKAAIKSFLTQKYPNSIVILGDMFELGTYADEEHTAVLNMLANENALKALLCGSNFWAVNRKSNNMLFFEKRETLIEYIKENPIANAHILIKGSRGMALEKVTPFL